MLEKTIEARLRDRISALGGLCLKLECPGYTGAPDRMILLPGGKIVFAETKKPGEKERARQQFVHRQFRQRGFTVYNTVDSLEKVDRIVAACQEAMGDEV